MDVLGYLRVSTDEQARSGYGLKAQEIAIKKAAKQRGWKIVELIRDKGNTGKTLERDGLHKALQRLAAGEAEGLVVAKLDRLTRSVPDFGMLLSWFKEAEAAFVALDFDLDTSTPNGKMVATMIMAVAEWEADVISLRTSDGLQAARAQGNPIGPPAVSDRPEVAKRIQELRDPPNSLSMRAIADKLNEEKVPTLRGGKKWRVSSVQTVLGYTRPTRRRRPTVLPTVKKRGKRAAVAK